MDEERLKKRYDRERQARLAAEALLEQKSLELFKRNQELEELKDNLELKVIARTYEVEKAKEDADRANHAKTQFLANMSHEIRTPLTAIIGFAEMILQQDLNPQDSQKYLNTIIRSGRHLSALLGEILDVSNIETDRLSINPERFNLPQLLQDIEQVYELNCLHKQLDFSLKLDSSVPVWLTADPLRLTQVLNHLLSNAIRYTDQGSVSLNIAFDAAQQLLTFDVIDTGEGVAEHKQALIFESFQQDNPSKMHNLEGAGLGLYLAKNLTELMGGKLTINSTVGQGSTFSFSIKCHAQEGECHSLTDTEQSHSQLISIPKLQGQVLLVEDNKLNQELIMLHLEKTGVQVDLAENGELGIQKVLSGAYDLVLMDIQMPIMDGKQALQSLRQLGINLPIYALTANVMSDDIKIYDSLGFNGTLSKPIELPLLYKILNKHLKVGQSATLSKFVPTPEITALFYAELTKQHKMLDQSIQQSNYQELTHLSHVIKGAAATFGYDELGQLADQALLSLRKKEYKQGLTLCTKLRTSITEVLDEHIS
ncbi:ATP-binding protein [Paraglaciecola aestuariivivens]